jgi:adenylate cyclase
MVQAILIMDLAGFSELMEREGVGAALSEVWRLREIGKAEVKAHCGTWVKAWADNFAAVFPTVSQAKGAAEGVVARIRSSAGIGWGEVLLPKGDLWGVEVNRASRLGEDVAKAGEVLLTGAAQRALGGMGDD